jgi:ATP synthase protein I
MTEPPDDRPPYAVAAEWVSRITTVSLQMVLPAVLGFWVDQKLGTVMLFLVLGAILGMTTGMIQLVRMTSTKADGVKAPRKKPEDKPPET